MNLKERKEKDRKWRLLTLLPLLLCKSTPAGNLWIRGFGEKFGSKGRTFSCSKSGDEITAFRGAMLARLTNGKQSTWSSIRERERERKKQRASYNERSLIIIIILYFFENLEILEGVNENFSEISYYR